MHAHIVVIRRSRYARKLGCSAVKKLIRIAGTPPSPLRSLAAGSGPAFPGRGPLSLKTRESREDVAPSAAVDIGQGSSWQCVPLCIFEKRGQ